MPHHKHSLARLTGQGSSGQQLYRMQKTLSDDALAAILWQEDSRPSTQLDSNPSIMTIRLLESGHDRTINRSSRRIQSCAGSSR